ncbi:1004_t:CDS:10, partial [Ambispora gerdemannii]
MAATKAASSRGIRLQFKQKLVSSPAKPLSTNEVSKRLKNLHKELVNLEQEAIVTDSLQGVSRELVQPSLISHKDKGVKAYVASCLADLLRLYAPHAPYTERELKEIFEFFVNQLQFVTDDTDPYFDAYFYLLENLASVKIMLLMFDLQNCEELLTRLFREFFNAIRENTQKIVYGYFIDIMQQLIEEAHVLPQETIDIILYQFIKKRKEEHPAAYQLASAICRASTDKLQYYVCQYFSEVIVSSGKSVAPEVLSDFKTAHELIKELNRAAPGLLLNLDDFNLRMLVTQVLGEMFSEKGSSLAVRYENVWQIWLSRRNDKAAAVRIVWADYCIPLFQNHPELAKQVNDSIKSKMSDPDEKVRIAFCKVLGQIDYDSAHNLVDAELLSALAKRCRDRKHGVRQEAINALARLYNLAFSDIQDTAMTNFSWIPKEILNTLYTNDNEIVTCVEKALEEHILPHDNDALVRVERILTVLESLGGKAKKGFFSLFQRQRDAISDMEIFLGLCEQIKGEEGKENNEQFSRLLEQLIKRIANKLPDPQKAANHLSNFTKIGDAQLYKLIKDCMDPQSDYKTVKKSQKEVLKKIEQVSPSLYETFLTILRRISLTIINKDLIPLLMHKMDSVMSIDSTSQTYENRSTNENSDKSSVSQNNINESTSQSNENDSTNRNENESINQRNSNMEKAAHDLLKEISLRFPALYRSHISELTQLLAEDANELLIEDSLEALSQFSKKYPDETPQDSICKRRLMKYALEGSLQQAKYAAIVLGQMRDKYQIFTDLLQKIVPNLSHDSPNLLNHLSVLSELALYSSSKYEEESEAITKFIIKELLYTNRYQPANDEKDWVEDNQLDEECKAKVIGLKILVNNLLSLSEEQGAEESAKPVFKLLWKLIKDGGEIHPEKTTSLAFKSRLRLAAARAILKLARKKIYDKMVTVSDFQKLAWTIQDPCYNVRYGFASRLIKYCGGYQLSARFLSIFFLVAHEPTPAIRDMASPLVKVFLIKHSVAAKAQRDNTTLIFEMSLVRLIHLLSHTDLLESNQLLRATKYVEFFLETIANAENISFLYYIAGRIKQFQDLHAQEDPENLHAPKKSDNLYILSDLTQHIIREKCKAASWILPSYPGQVKLPADLFASLPTTEKMKEVMEKNYLPADFIKMLEKKQPTAHSKQEKAMKKPRSTSSTKKSQSPKKRRKIDTNKPVTPTRRTTPRAAKSKVLSMEEIEDSVDEGEETAAEEENQSMK